MRQVNPYDIDRLRRANRNLKISLVVTLPMIVAAFVHRSGRRLLAAGMTFALAGCSSPAPGLTATSQPSATAAARPLSITRIGGVHQPSIDGAGLASTPAASYLSVPHGETTTVTAIDHATGRSSWRVELPYRDGYLFVAGDAILVTSYFEEQTLDQIVALDPATGAERWSVRFKGLFDIVDDTVVIAYADALRGIDTTTGETRWERPDKQYEPVSADHYTRLFLYAYSGHTLSRLDPRSGTATALGAVAEGYRHVVLGDLFVAYDRNAGLSGYRLTDLQKPLWTVNAAAVAAPDDAEVLTVCGDLLVCVRGIEPDGRFAAFRADTGKPAATGPKTSHLQGLLPGLLAVADESQDRELLLDAMTGEQVADLGPASVASQIAEDALVADDQIWDAALRRQTQMPDTVDAAVGCAWTTGRAACVTKDKEFVVYEVSRS
ncbi:outer membrane protein assembly factor BamB family protein [Micromonosporaceae bacterium Da 78-11]